MNNKEKVHEPVVDKPAPPDSPLQSVVELSDAMDDIRDVPNAPIKETEDEVDHRMENENGEELEHGEEGEDAEVGTNELSVESHIADQFYKTNKNSLKKYYSVRNKISTIRTVPFTGPVFLRQCKVCRHPDHDEIYQEKLRGVSDNAIALKYFPQHNPRTVQNSLSRHWRKHLQAHRMLVYSQNAHQPPAATTARRPLPTSTERIFSHEMKQQVNALANIEAVIVNLAEKLNILEDIFLEIHINQKCKKCGRSEATDKHLTQMLKVIDRFVKANEEWIRIKNPKEVMRLLFVSTFLRFVKSMMGHYASLLYEKTQIIRQSVNDYAADRISLQLMLRRISEVEDLGVQTLTEKSIREMREIQEYIETQFNKSAWGTPNPTVVPPTNT